MSHECNFVDCNYKRTHRLAPAPTPQRRTIYLSNLDLKANAGFKRLQAEKRARRKR